MKEFLSENEKYLYVFVGGTGRSGTTIIGKLLNHHSNIRLSKPVEIKFLAGNAGILDLTYGLKEFIEMKKSKTLPMKFLLNFPSTKSALAYRKFNKKIVGQWWTQEKRPGKGTGLSSGLHRDFLDLALERYRINRKIDLEFAAREFFMTMVHNQSNNRGEKIWVDTSPPNIMNADRINLLIPGARFINMNRDGKNTIASVLKEHWGPNDPLKAVHWWKNRVRIGHKALSKIPSEFYLNLQLEELAYFDRDRQYQKVLNFLEMDDDPKMRNFFDKKVNGSKVIEKKWRNEITHPQFEKVFMKACNELKSEGIYFQNY